jgi:putative ABC transport system substrate-binding protein
MSRKAMVVWLVALALVPFSLAEVQQPGKVPRIGYLSATSPSVDPARREAFLQGLRELGYVERKNIVIEWRYTEGKLDRLAALAAELVRPQVDVIVSGGSLTTRAAKQATDTIPIVMAQDGDPVRNGFVASLARPGGNVTGLATLTPEISGKRLELLKETIPRLSRLAVLGSSTEPGNALSLRETELAARAFGVQIQYLEVADPKEVGAAFQALSKGRADAILVLSGTVVNQRRAEIVDLAVKNRLPAIYYAPVWVEDGGLMSYGPSFNDLYRRAATYVDKILKGAKPADLPVEQPTKFEFVINLKAAKQIGLTIPPNVLARADKVIK